MGNWPRELRNSTWFHKNSVAVKVLAEVTDSRVQIHCTSMLCPGTCEVWNPFCRRCGKDVSQSKTLIKAIVTRFTDEKTEKHQEYLCSNSRSFVRGDADQTCAICLGGYESGDKILQTSCCLHLFHTKCMQKWIHESNSCPMCRTEMLECEYSPKSILAHSGFGTTFVFC